MVFPVIQAELTVVNWATKSISGGWSTGQVCFSQELNICLCSNSVGRTYTDISPSNAEADFIQSKRKHGFILKII